MSLPSNKERFMSTTTSHTEQQGNTMTTWTNVCSLADINPDTGVCALVNGKQVAVFRYGEGEQVYAISNFDPFGNANVLSRGILGSIGDRPVVASPLYKQHFDLTTGECLEDADVKIPNYPVTIENGVVKVAG
tara:strand:- start:1683 stop:2081 length:399 start_codon:yes stop_codon:yes gene_type:complete